MKPRLLIVDDEAAHMQALCDTLEDHGYETVGCQNGEAALTALQSSPFDLLLADLMMPGMSGIALLREAIAIDPTLVGIIMTGEGTITSAVDAMRSGALDYILKPFKVSAILPVLGRGLTVRRLQLENAALERRVKEHVVELEAANRELDAFTRSASHDLRAPLNIIMGFSSLLVKDLSTQLQPEQREWLSHIERSAQRMNQLIDALMRLSRVGRQTLMLQTVDTAALVRGVVEELRKDEPDRQLELKLDPLPPTTADASLLRQLFVNLLSNAFKFTRNTEQALIEVGCTTLEGEGPVFYVRDNGAGFDVTRAKHLFAPFQRYHRADLFEGSGVGLSIVQRIVQRHNGGIWAQSAPNEGASFFFTLRDISKQIPPTVW
jgi:signal transduction histidine kinase